MWLYGHYCSRPLHCFAEALFPLDPSFLPQAAKSTPAAEPKPQTPLPPDWVEGVDPASGVPYYFHTPTGKSQWERPAPPASRSGGAALPPPPPPPKLPGLPAGWKEAVDSESGKNSEKLSDAKEYGRHSFQTPVKRIHLGMLLVDCFGPSCVQFFFCFFSPPPLVSCPLREQRR
jgi:hypothetical protein